MKKSLFIIILFALLLVSCAPAPVEEVGYNYYVKYSDRSEDWSALEYEYCRTESSSTNLIVYCWVSSSSSHFSSSADYSAEILEFKREKSE